MRLTGWWRTLPGRVGADGQAAVGEAVVDERGAADGGRRERQPQQRGAQEHVDGQVAPVRRSLPVHLLVPEVVLLLPRPCAWPAQVACGAPASQFLPAAACPVSLPSGKPRVFPLRQGPYLPAEQMLKVAGRMRLQLPCCQIAHTEQGNCTFAGSWRRRLLLPALPVRRLPLGLLQRGQPLLKVIVARALCTGQQILSVFEQAYIF